jgi:hypothetical protein
MKTWLSGDVSKRLTRDGGAETAHELEAEIEQIRAGLAANEAERKELEAALRDLASRRSIGGCKLFVSRHCRCAEGNSRVTRRGKDRAISEPVRGPR